MNDPIEIAVANLSLEDQNIVWKHLQLSGEIEKILNIRTYLIKEFDVKKRMDVETKDTVIAYQYYLKYLFTNRTMNLIFSGVFPCHFRKQLTKLLKQELTNCDWDHTSIYYQWNYPIFVEKKKEYAYFNKNEWKLNKSPHMTELDIEIFNRYRIMLLTLFENTIQLVRSNKAIINEYDKICINFDKVCKV